MPAQVEKRREFLINIMFFAVIIALVYVFFKYLFWVTAPFFLTFLIAILLQKPIRILDKKSKHNLHTFWSILLVILVLLVIIVPFAFILSALITRVTELIKTFMNQMSDIPAFLTTLQNKILNLGKFLPDSVYAAYSDSIKNTFSKLIEDFNLSSLGINASSIKNGVSSGLSGVFGVVKNIPGIAIGVVIGIIACIFLTKDYDRVVRFIQLQLPDGKKNILVEFKQVFTTTILKMVRAYLLIMIITFLELTLGFTILKVTHIMNNNYYIWIALGITIFDILPIAGSGGVLIPWSLISLVLGNYKMSIGVIIIYITITVVRQYIEPKIVGDSLGVHPLITLMGLYFGLKLFGFLGMFIVPITVMTLKAFNDTGRIHLWTPPKHDIIKE